MRVALAAVLAACAAQPPPAARVAPPAQPPRTAPPAAKPVRWSNITTVDNCFYFSGPFNGRDEQLHGVPTILVEGATMRLRLATAVFEGPLEAGRVTLTRVTRREHEDATWTVTETVVGAYIDGELRAQYRYEECDPRDACPGRCTMTADLVAR